MSELEDSDTQSQNHSIMFKARFDEVCRLFEKTDTNDYVDLCLSLLQDPRLPYAYRIPCHYFYAFASDEPQVELEKGRAIISRLDEMIAAGTLGHTMWLDKQKEAYQGLENQLPFVNKSSNDNDDDIAASERPPPTETATRSDALTIGSAAKIAETPPSSNMVHAAIHQMKGVPRCYPCPATCLHVRRKMLEKGLLVDKQKKEMERGTTVVHEILG
ncbi:hypothetical protein PMZ80_007568 [Knufia obscura]|uniref:Uncharacterized protein n=1 Tax=Knufia obscura TaxID=1635080 RepID=A0ABR0RJ57_9EURO|nr:hypothetical protein PMZ80_007568 [Knufia obscura]